MHGGHFVVRPPGKMARHYIFKRRIAKKQRTTPPRHSCRSRTLYPAELRSHVIFGVPAGGNLYSIPNPAGKCKCFLCRRQNFFAGHFQKHLPCRVSPGTRGEKSAPPGNPAAGGKPPGGLQATSAAKPSSHPTRNVDAAEHFHSGGKPPPCGMPGNGVQRKGARGCTEMSQ